MLATGPGRRVSIPVMISPMDRRYGEGGERASMEPQPNPGPAGTPPSSIWDAMWRGIRDLCPACSGPALFPTFLKPMSVCPACGQDWTHQRADDFPAYVAMLITGHIIVTLAITLEHLADPPVWVHLAIWLPLATLLVVGLLQPVKGAIIAIQWWYGMHGFEAGAKRKSAPPPSLCHNDIG